MSEKPSKPKTIKATFVFPLDLMDELRELAWQHRRSLVGEIVWALRQYVAQQRSQKS